MQCKYKACYLNLESNKRKKFMCRNPAISSCLCKFHEPEYLTRETEKEIVMLFMHKMKNAMKQKRPLMCIGYRLPQIIVKNKKFAKSVYFAKAIFEDVIRFEGTTFKSAVQFSESQFKRGLRFSRTIFEDQVDFSDAKINGSSLIFDSTFEEKVKFEGAEISNITFDSTFKKIATFVRTKVKKTSFSLSTFNEVDFTDAISLLELDFYRTKFEKAIFERATIKNSRFTQAIFNEASFSYSNFLGKIDFKDAEFKGRTYFQNCKFNDVVEFENSAFRCATIFEGSTFADYANFRNVQFYQQDKVKFNGNLSNVSFLRTDITRIRFGNDVIWSEGKDPYLILEERILAKDAEQGLHLEDVMDLYRHLRDNYEFYSRYDMSSYFYIRELELSRKYRKNDAVQDQKTIKKSKFRSLISILSAFYLVSKYGQSYLRPLSFGLIGVAFSTMYFWTSGFSNTATIFSEGLLSNSFSYSLLRAVSAFFPFLTFGNHHTTSDFLLRIALLPITGTFILSLKRALERKLRH